MVPIPVRLVPVITCKLQRALIFILFVIFSARFYNFGKSYLLVYLYIIHVYVCIYNYTRQIIILHLR